MICRLGKLPLSPPNSTEHCLFDCLQLSSLLGEKMDMDSALPKMGDVIADAQALLTFVFSWIVLLGIGVIVSGKLTAQHIVLGLGEDDLFSINLVAFRIRAKGDEVSLGFVLYFFCLVAVIVLGGPEAYTILKERAGLDIGHWNSICVIASFLSIISAALLRIMRPVLTRAPIVTDSERTAIIKKLQEKAGE